MRRGTRLITYSLSMVLTFATIGVGTAHALTSTTQPQLTLNRLIQTSPFVGTTTKVSDNEGSAYVASDDAFWMADDNGDALWVVDRTTGVLRRKVAQSEFINAPRFGVGGTAGQSRTEDLEALAYDANADVIYAFSGSTSAIPTVFRLTRDANHQFQVQSWQPLPSEWTGAGWRLADGLLYVVNSGTFRTYDFATNTFGPTFSISGISKVYGMDFDDATGDMLVVNSSQKLYRVSMPSRTILPGWNGISLTGFGLLDTRAVEVIGEQVFITDGADTNRRSSSSPMFHAVFVFDVSGPGGPGPTAGFTATPTTGTAPLTVNFTDTSTGSPTSWSWNFGDGATSTVQSPSHVYGSGTFTATLTATNALGFSSASRTITVSPPTASFTATPTSGTVPLTVKFTDTSTGLPTGWSWDFGDQTPTSTEQSPSHDYVSAGTFTATLTTAYAQGNSSATKTITVNEPTAPTASFTATPTSGTAPLTVNFTDTSTGSPTSWSWDFADGTTSTEQSPSHVFTTIGTFTVQLTATNVTGSTSTTKTITVSSTAVITPSADTQINLSGGLVPGSAPSFSADGSPVSDGLLKFNVNVGGQITGAKLRLYCVDPSSAGGTFYAAAETNPPWSENTVTWATAPVAGASYGSLGAVKVGFWYEVDLSALVTANGSYTLRIKNTSTNGADYATKEGAAGFAPQLVVTTA